MSDELPHPTDPAREAPPTGLKITLVLIGVIVACCLACAALGVGYAYYLDLRSAR